MEGLVWENSWITFFVITICLAGGAAWLSGQALARSWRPLSLVVFYMLALGAVSRFFNWGLADGSLLSLHYYLVDTAVLIAIGALSWQVARTTLMVRQYPWLYERRGLLGWTEKS